MKELLLPHVRKIAILRANALGDLLVTLPAIEAVRQAYPQAEITLLGKPWHQAFVLPGRTPVDHVIVVPVSKGIREEAGMNENADELDVFFAAMRAEQFDIALHFQGQGIAANPFINRLGAKLTVGLTCPEAGPLDRSVDFYYYQNEVIRYREVARLIGAEPVSLEPRIRVLPADERELYHTFGETLTEPFVVLHPCAADVRRMWLPEKFAQTADLLAADGYQVIFTGSLSDKPVIAAMLAQTTNPNIRSCTKLSLGGMTALLSRSSLVIASDTGPLHLARATGAKTVGIYWAPNLINWGPLTRTNHRPAVSWQMACPQCGVVPNNPYPFEPQSSQCQHQVSFVRDVSVKEVMHHARQLLATNHLQSGYLTQAYDETETNFSPTAEAMSYLQT